MQKIIVIAVIVIALGAGIYFIDKGGGPSVTSAGASQVIELQDGSTYDLAARFVDKDIGGKTYRMLAYNGSIPGPLLRVPQGAEVTVNFRNDLDVETSLHPHGLRLDNQFDGAVPLTQEAVAPGGTFTYKLKFPDAGMYWYHPHMREDHQQELGLYGGFLVVPSDSSYWNPVDREVPLFLDDIAIENGSLAPINKEKASHTLMGRFGNTMLVNGESDYVLKAKQGEAIRLYIVNAANTRPFNFAIKGARLRLVGADGGAYERESWVDAVTLSPSERAIIEVRFDKEGTYDMENRTPEKTYRLGSVKVEGTTGASLASDFESLRTNALAKAAIDPFRQYFGKPVDKTIDLTIDMMGMGNMGGHMMPDGSMMGGSMMGAPGPDGIEWEDANPMMNEMSDEDTIQWKIVDPSSKKENMAIDWKFKAGDKVKIKIANPSTSGHPMQHPIHFHGNRFLIISTDGVANENLVWKDTVLVPAGKSVEILLDASNPGEWMAHCHIAEHLSDGMMFSYTVE